MKSYRNNSSKLTAVIGLLLLSGCGDSAPEHEPSSGGGSGGSAPVMEEPEQEEPDAFGGMGGAGEEPEPAEPLALENRSPLPDADDVWLRAPIEATFNNALDAATVDSETVRVVSGGNELDVSIDLSDDGRTIQITLNEFPPATDEETAELQVLLDGAISDRQGSSAGDISWSFFAPEWLVFEPLVRDPEADRIGSYDVAVDDGAGVFVTWIEEDPNLPEYTYHVYGSYWRGDHWEDLGGKLSLPFDGGSGVSLATQGAVHGDTPVIAHLDAMFDGGRRHVIVKRWSGEEWTPLGGFHDAYPTRAYDFALALNSSGEPALLWEEYARLSAGDPHNEKTLLGSQWRGKEWSGPTELTNDGAPLPAWSVGLAVDGQDRLVVITTNNDGDGDDNIDGSQVYVWRAGADGAVVPFGDGPNPTTLPAEDPSMALDADDRPWVAFAQEGLVKVKRWTGTTWERIDGDQLDASELSPAHDPTLAFDHEGHAVLGWREASKLHLRRWDGQDWVAMGAERSTGSPGVVFDAFGAPVVHWQEQTDTEAHLFVERYNR